MLAKLERGRTAVECHDALLVARDGCRRLDYRRPGVVIRARGSCRWADAWLSSPDGATSGERLLTGRSLVWLILTSSSLQVSGAVRLFKVRLSLNLNKYCISCLTRGQALFGRCRHRNHRAGESWVGCVVVRGQETTSRIEHSHRPEAGARRGNTGALGLEKTASRAMLVTVVSVWMRYGKHEIRAGTLLGGNGC